MARQRRAGSVMEAGILCMAACFLACLIAVQATPLSGQASNGFHQSSHKAVKVQNDSPLKAASDKYKSTYGSALSRDSASIHSGIKDAINTFKAASSSLQKDSSLYSPEVSGAAHEHAHGMASVMDAYGNQDDVQSYKGMQVERDSKKSTASELEGDFVSGYPGYYQMPPSMYGPAAAPVAPAAPASYPSVLDDQRYKMAAMYNNNPQCNPCGPPPCPFPCPPPPAPPVPCVTEVPLVIQYLINIVTIALGIGILKWYCSAMSELDRQCGLDDRQGGGDDALSRSLSTKKSSFSPPMATISAYYDPYTNQVLLPQEHHYQFTR